LTDPLLSEDEKPGTESARLLLMGDAKARADEDDPYVYGAGDEKDSCCSEEVKEGSVGEANPKRGIFVRWLYRWERILLFVL